jgi:hypothetical protein
MINTARYVMHFSNQYSHYIISLFYTFISNEACNDSTLHSAQGYKWKSSCIKLYMEGWEERYR